MRLLSHDLNSGWGILCGATYLLEQETSSSADRELVESIQNRATQRLQAIVTQVAQHFPQQTLVGQLSRSLTRRDEAPWSTALLEQLTPLVNAVKQLLH